jgi:glycosyltransferase involved in cell wall biosynthesis
LKAISAYTIGSCKPPSLWLSEAPMPQLELVTPASSAALQGQSAALGLRLLHCISSVNPANGGPIEGLKQLSSVYNAKGYSVEIVSLDHPDAPWVKTCPFKVHALGPTYIGKWAYAPKLTNWMKAHTSDFGLVIVNGIWQYHAFGIWRALKGTNLPYFVFTHGMLDPWFKRNYPLKHLKKWLFWPWAEYRVLRDSAGVLFTCEEERRLARQSFWLYQCKEHVVTYGTNRPPLDREPQVRAFLERFPQLQGKRCLLFLGRVHEKKGADLLFKATARVKALRPQQFANVQLVMAGPADHSYGQEMRSLAQTLGLADQTTWTGMIQGDLKWGAFQQAEAFVLPSHQENFGIAVAEALACQLPVLISNQVNIWREVVDAKAGYAEPDTLDGTVQLLLRWLDTEPQQWQQMRAAGRQCFESRFVIEKAADSISQAYLRHMANRESSVSQVAHHKGSQL